MKNVQAIILAAGKGTRLNNGSPSPLPKALLNLEGQPIVEYAFNTLKKIGIRKPIFVIGYKDEMIKKYFGNRGQYVKQKKLLGTGHAAWQGIKAVPLSIKSILVIQCDDSAFYQPATLKQLIEIQSKNQCAIALLSVQKNVKIGRIIKDKGQIREIIEKENMTPELYKKYKLVNCGGYCFDSQWAKKNFPKLKKNGLNRYDLTDMVKMAIKQKQKVLDLEIPTHEWIGVNTPEQYEEAKKAIKKIIDGYI